MKRQIILTLLPIGLVIFFLSFSYITIAAPGDLDPTFSGDGKLTDWSGYATGVAIQPDGKVVVVGTGPDPTYDYRVTRYNLDGTPDTTFGGGTGRVTTDFGQWDPALSVLIQPDGKILVGGSTVTGYAGGFGLARYNSDGSLDTQFGDGTGMVMTPTPDGCGTFSYGVDADIAIQPDGKILGVIAYADFDGNCETDGFIFRYDSDGSLDTSFGSNGTAFTEGPLWSVGLQPADGKIVAVSYYTITRFNTNGSLDPDFGSGGVVTIPPSYLAFSVAIQSDGKIIGAGATSNGQPQSDFAILRLNANGSPDTSFDGDGIVTTPIGSGDDYVRSIVIQSDAKILAAGITFIGASADFALARYNPDGTLDTTFGGDDGVMAIDFNNSLDAPNDLALDGQGRAVVVGESGGMFAIARFMLGGTAPPTTKVSVSGRVIAANGRGLANVTVTLMDTSGNRRSAQTNPFGFYQFTDVAAPGTYTLTAISRRFQFDPQVISVNGDVTDVNFVAQAPKVQGSPSTSPVSVEYSLARNKQNIRTSTRWR